MSDRCVYLFNVSFVQVTKVERHESVGETGGGGKGGQIDIVNKASLRGLG